MFLGLVIQNKFSCKDCWENSNNLNVSWIWSCLASAEMLSQALKSVWQDESCIDFWKKLKYFRTLNISIFGVAPMPQSTSFVLNETTSVRLPSASYHTFSDPQKCEGIMLKTILSQNQILLRRLMLIPKSACIE